jgi:hypothetical protein
MIGAASASGRRSEKQALCSAVMRLFSCRWVLLGITSIMMGCTVDASLSSANFGPTAPPTSDTALVFEQKDTLKLEPGEERTLWVQATPAAPYEINFVIDRPSWNDASLDRVTVKADKHGRAAVTLRAPSKAATFHLRAWIKDGPSAELPISVSSDGFASVQVIPQYMGQRDITTYTAIVVARTTCAAVAPKLPDEPVGAIAVTAKAEEPLIVPDVPVGPNLAVVVRAGHFAWGCADADDLVANTTQNVKVNVIDRPLDLSSTKLDLAFTLQPQAVPFQKILGHASQMLLDSFAPPSKDAGPLLLDEMMAAAPPDGQQAFQAARTAGGWDKLATAHIASLPATPRSAMEFWIQQGLADGTPLLLRGQLDASGATPGYALFKPTSLGVVDAAAAGIPGVKLVNLTAQAGDEVDLSTGTGNLFWLPSRYVGGVCVHQALAGAEPGTTMKTALANAAGCDDLGAALGGFDGCDAGCMALLCADALEARWQGALDASAAAGIVGEMKIVAVGRAKVDDAAAPVSLEGSWTGMVSDGDVSASVEKSPFIGQPPASP